MVSPILAPQHGSAAVSDGARSRKRRRHDSCESDENHNTRERCPSSLSSSSMSSDMPDVMPSADHQHRHRDNDADVEGVATDLSVRRSRSSSSDDVRRNHLPLVGANTSPHPTVVSTGASAAQAAAPLSLSLHVQQALQHQMQLAMRYMQQPVYPPTTATPAHRWLPWLGVASTAAAAAGGVEAEQDDDSSTTGSTTTTTAANGGCAAETQLGGGGGGAGEVRRKRSRVFIDPLTEIPRLEQWFSIDSHPSSTAIERLTDELNRSAYRQRFPALEPKNVQLWFKNHRAKVKRQSFESLALTSPLVNDVKDDAILPASLLPLPSNHYCAASDAIVTETAVS